MTIRKRLSRTNTRILLFALLSLLVIGVFIIEIFEKTYLEQAINYVKLQDHSVELVDFWMNINFRRMRSEHSEKRSGAMVTTFILQKTGKESVRIFLQNSFGRCSI